MGYDKRISELPQAGSLDGTELFAVVQGGVTKYTTSTNLNYVTSNNYGLFNQTGSSAPVFGSTHVSGSLISGGVGTLSVPANGFTKGDAYQATFSGVINAENNKRLQIQVKTDSVILADTELISMPGITGDKRWRMDIDFSIREIGGAGVAEIATAGTIMFRTDASGDVVTEIFSDVNNTTFDTTIDNTLEVEAVWSNGPTDLSSIYSKLFTLMKTF